MRKFFLFICALAAINCQAQRRIYTQDSDDGMVRATMSVPDDPYAGSGKNRNITFTLELLGDQGGFRLNSRKPGNFKVSAGGIRVHQKAPKPFSRAFSGGRKISASFNPRPTGVDPFRLVGGPANDIKVEVRLVSNPNEYREIEVRKYSFFFEDINIPYRNAPVEKFSLPDRSNCQVVANGTISDFEANFEIVNGFNAKVNTRGRVAGDLDIKFIGSAEKFRWMGGYRYLYISPQDIGRYSPDIAAVSETHKQSIIDQCNECAQRPQCLCHIPVFNWTMEQANARRNQVIENDKRAFCGTISYGLRVAGLKNGEEAGSVIFGGPVSGTMNPWSARIEDRSNASCNVTNRKLFADNIDLEAILASGIDQLRITAFPVGPGKLANGATDRIKCSTGGHVSVDVPIDLVAVEEALNNRNQ